MAIKKYLSLNALTFLTDSIKNELSKKADIVYGKQLSTNDYSDEEKNKVNICFEHVISSDEDLISKLYPIGSIYLSTNQLNPSTLLGFGTWRQIKDKFLLASGDAYPAGSTGGESEHSLTIDEMPSHNHNLLRPQWYSIENGDLEGQNSIYGISNKVTNAYIDYSSISNSGGNYPHNNMPPYLSVYVWERIA